MPETATLKTSVVERFLHYVTIDTQSAEGSSTYPSTLKQLVLLDLLVEELKAIGLNDAARDEHGYVMATIPSTTKKPNVPVIGFLAHVDTSPEMSGANVKPIVHRNWQGNDIVLPDDPLAMIRRARASGARASRSATTSSRRPARRCSAPTTRRASPRSSRRPST